VNAPRILLTVRDVAHYLIEMLTDIRTQLTRMEKHMATKADLEASLAHLQSAVTSKVQDVSDKLAAMQTTLDQFVADDTLEDAAYQQQIDDLKAQLSSDLSAAVAAVDAMASAVSGSQS
jgi:predicted  nucleic acid-binding Zn-ribbon protein